MAGLIFKVFYEKPNLIPFTDIGVYPDKVNLNEHVNLDNASGNVLVLEPVFTEPVVRVSTQRLLYAEGFSLDSSYVTTVAQTGSAFYCLTEDTDINFRINNRTQYPKASIITGDLHPTNVIIDQQTGDQGAILTKTFEAQNSNLVIEVESGSVGAVLTHSYSSDDVNLRVVNQSGSLNYLFIDDIDLPVELVRANNYIIYVNEGKGLVDIPSTAGHAFVCEGQDVSGVFTHWRNQGGQTLRTVDADEQAVSTTTATDKSGQTLRTYALDEQAVSTTRVSTAAGQASRCSPVDEQQPLGIVSDSGSYPVSLYNETAVNIGVLVATANPVRSSYNETEVHVGIPVAIDNPVRSLYIPTTVHVGTLRSTPVILVPAVTAVVDTAIVKQTDNGSAYGTPAAYGQSLIGAASDLDTLNNVNPGHSVDVYIEPDYYVGTTVGYAVASLSAQDLGSGHTFTRTSQASTTSATLHNNGITRLLQQDYPSGYLPDQFVNRMVDRQITSLLRIEFSETPFVDDQCDLAIEWSTGHPDMTLIEGRSLLTLSNKSGFLYSTGTGYLFDYHETFLTNPAVVVGDTNVAVSKGWAPIVSALSNPAYKWSLGRQEYRTFTTDHTAYHATSCFLSVYDDTTFITGYGTVDAVAVGIVDPDLPQYVRVILK